MSAFTGSQGKGAMRRHREQKRDDAETRNAATPPERRRSYRLALTPEQQLLHALFAEADR